MIEVLCGNDDDGAPTPLLAARSRAFRPMRPLRGWGRMTIAPRWIVRPIVELEASRNFSMLLQNYTLI